MRMANSFICLPFCACMVSLCLFIVYIAHLFGRLTFFAAGTETEAMKGPLPAAAQSAQAVFPCLLAPFVCSTFCCSATHTLCHLPTDISRYKAVQAKPILIQLRVSPTHSNTHTHMQSNENQWILLQKHCRWSLPTSPSAGSSELSLSIAYRRAPNCTQTIGWSGEGMGRTHGPLTIINWPFDAENLPVAVSPVVGHCNYFAVKQETMATINLIHTRAQLPRVTSHQSLRVCCTQLDGPSTFLWQADWLWAYHCLWPYQRQCTVKMSSLCHKRCLPRAP